MRRFLLTLPRDLMIRKHLLSGLNEEHDITAATVVVVVDLQVMCEGRDLVISARKEGILSGLVLAVAPILLLSLLESPCEGQ